MLKVIQDKNPLIWDYTGAYKGALVYPIAVNRSPTPVIVKQAQHYGLTGIFGLALEGRKSIIHFNTEVGVQTATLYFALASGPARFERLNYWQDPTPKYLQTTFVPDDPKAFMGLLNDLWAIHSLN